MWNCCFHESKLLEHQYFKCIFFCSQEHFYSVPLVGFSLPLNQGLPYHLQHALNTFFPFFWHYLPLSPKVLERVVYIHCVHVHTTHSRFSVLPSDPPSLYSPEAASGVSKRSWNCIIQRLYLFFTMVDLPAAWKHCDPRFDTLTFLDFHDRKVSWLCLFWPHNWFFFLCLTLIIHILWSPAYRYPLSSSSLPWEPHALHGFICHRWTDESHIYVSSSNTYPAAEFPSGLCASRGPKPRFLSFSPSHLSSYSFPLKWSSFMFLPVGPPLQHFHHSFPTV